MIYVVTAHHLNPRWIAPQTEYLRRHLSEPYEVFASCEGIDEHWFASFDHVVPSVGKHAGKLNLLAAEISAIAAPDDLLMFLDGDAFPIADPMPVVRAALARAPLVAVRRSEMGQIQPHPSFCVTSVATWRHLNGDWSPGYPWPGQHSRPTDVGANLLRSLERAGVAWEPLVRSNTVNLHPVFFGVYGSIVYHHGAGFRTAFPGPERSRIERMDGGLVRHVPVLSRAVKHFIRGHQKRSVIQKHESMSAEVFDALVRDPDFWHRFEC